MANFTERTMETFDSRDKGVSFGQTIQISQEKSYTRRYEAARKRAERGRRIKAGITKLVLLAGGAATLVVAGPRIATEVADTFSTTEADRYERVMEECVGELVGRKVNLVQDPLGDGLQHPRSVFAEQRACERNDGNPDLARTDIRPIPLASPGN